MCANPIVVIGPAGMFADSDNGFDSGEFRFNLLHGGKEILTNDEHLGLRIINGIEDLWWGQAPVH